MFHALKDMEKPTPPLTRAPSPHWISAMPLRLIDVRADHCCRPGHNRNVAHTLTKELRNYLAVDTFLRA